MVEIIAEIGVNHDNDLSKAFELIDRAKGAGADVAKFQASTVEGEISKRAAPAHYRLIESLIPDMKFLAECADRCADVGIEFMCTPAEEESLKALLDLGMKRIKVGSDNLTNIVFLDAVCAAGLPVILSTGMAVYDEIVVAAGRITHSGPTLLHCTSAYPCPIRDANLLVIPDMKRWHIGPVGWSDHTESYTLPSLAVSLGAVMIEKHLTHDRTADGPDHRASLNPFQFALMVEHIRQAEEALGDRVKAVMPSEDGNRLLMRKSIVAKRFIRSGELFTAANLAVKRPGTGISPFAFYKLAGRVRASRDYDADELIMDAELK